MNKWAMWVAIPENLRRPMEWSDGAVKAKWVTTLDNPYNFFKQFDEWYAFDTQMGYNTCSYVDRIAKTSNSMSEHDRKQAINDAVDEIVRFNLTGNYVMVEQEDDDDEENEEKDEYE